MKIVKILRLLKIVKMLRIVKIPTQLRHLETMFNRGVLRLITFMSAAILVTHLCACFFYYSSYLEGFDEVRSHLATVLKKSSPCRILGSGLVIWNRLLILTDM